MSSSNKTPKIFLFFNPKLSQFKFDLNMALAASTVSDQVFIILPKKYNQKINSHKLYKKQLRGLKALGVNIIISPAPLPCFYRLNTKKIKKPNLINYNELVDLLA